MNRRGFLAGVGSALAVAGCTQRTASGTAGGPTDTATIETTNTAQPTEPPPSRSPATFTPQSAVETETWAEGAEGPPQPALEIHHGGPIDGNSRRVTVTITEPDTDSVVFERVGTLEPGESVAFEDPVGQARTYRLDISLANGASATGEIKTIDGDIPNYMSYVVAIFRDDIEIRRTEV